ncbi:hypothetical protein EDB80DRAFT_252839 [Ilyonectria destructans]|nr:hypothetical protein EDB80DRAFT_252839 [Ilyonectria destructans]
MACLWARGASDPALAMALALALAWPLAWELLSLASLTLPSPMFNVYDHLDFRQLRCQLLSYPPTVPSSSFCRCAQATIQQPKAQLSLPTAPQKPTASHPTTSHHITPMTPRHAWPMVPPCPYCDPPVLALSLHRSFEPCVWSLLASQKLPPNIYQLHFPLPLQIRLLPSSHPQLLC